MTFCPCCLAVHHKFHSSVCIFPEIQFVNQLQFFSQKNCFYFTQDDRRPKGGNLCTKLFFECPEFSPLFLSTLKKLFHLNVIFFNYIFALEIQQFVSFFMIAWYLYSGWNFTQFLYVIIYFYTAWQELWLKCILVATYYVAILPIKCFFYKDNNIDFF